jgi:hypothetical protein
MPVTAPRDGRRRVAASRGASDVMRACLARRRLMLLSCSGSCVVLRRPGRRVDVCCGLWGLGASVSSPLL